MSTRKRVAIDDLDTFQPAGECPNCKLNVAFIHRSRRQVWPELVELSFGRSSGPDFNGPSQASERPDMFRVVEHVLQCPRCRKTCVLHQHSGPDLPEDLEKVGEALEAKASKVRFTVCVYPAGEPDQLAPEAPESVRGLFAEGARCEQAGALRAAGAMYRAAVEELCADRGAEGNNLIAKIADLVNRGVPAELARDLDEARMLGNWSPHKGLNFFHDEVADVASLIKEAVFLLYVQPVERSAGACTASGISFTRTTIFTPST
ncbi:DUF4145 domain-containing protein [Streptomyces sp. NPDC087908]|uniref:DUF4145 domain-containing protein n=1 Tax=Streptomyces sp. NPDC087908 TaxID=3365820 RepID=UPI0037F7E836